MLLSIYKWVVLVPVVGISTVLVGSVCLVLCMVVPPSTAGRWCGKSWARINAVAALMGVTVEGAEHVDAGRSMWWWPIIRASSIFW
jgi:hypothetical protein